MKTDAAPPPLVRPLERWRRLSLYLFLFGTGGTAIELLFLGHVEDPWQWAPVALLMLGIGVAALLAVRPDRGRVRALRILSLGYILAAALGLYFHVKANVEFELELHPTMTGFELLIETLTGAIPALAPGAMAQLGLLGLIVSLRHPALETGTPR